MCKYSYSSVGVDQLFQVSKDLLMQAQKEFVRKPGSVNLKEINLLNSFAKK